MVLQNLVEKFMHSNAEKSFFLFVGCEALIRNLLAFPAVNFFMAIEFFREQPSLFLMGSETPVPHPHLTS